MSMMNQDPQRTTKPNRPCDRCRKRKTKCVIEEGQYSCYFCVMSGVQCEYNLPPVKKKKKAKSPELSDLQPVDLSSFVGNGSHERMAPTVVDESIPNPRGLRTRGITYSYNMEGNNEFDSYIFKDLISDSKIILNSSSSTEGSILKHDNELFMEINSKDSEIDRYERELDKINKIVGESGAKLVALYFRIVHSSFPILVETKFMASYNDATATISPSLLSCLYLFALNWWTFDSDLSTGAQPSQSNLEVLAEENLYKELKRPTISTIQAGLLLIQHQSFQSSFDNHFESWPMQSAVLAAAQTLGLYKDPSNWNIPHSDKSVRKRLSWALFIQEKWLSLTLDKSSHIYSDDWLVGDLDENLHFRDFKDLTPQRSIEGMIDYNSGKTLFLQKIELSKIVDEISHKLNSNRARVYLESLGDLDPLSALEGTLEYIKPLQVLLTSWEAQLPKILIIESSVSRGFISGAPNIYISNFMAQISILRPVLRVLSKVRDSYMVVSKQFIGIRDIVFNKCMAIFDNVLKFFNELRAEHLQTFWYTSAKNGFSNIVVFGYLLTLTSKNKEEFDNCLDIIEEYVWKLKINNKNAQFLSHAILWWSQLKKLLTKKLETFTFYNEEHVTTEDVRVIPIIPEKHSNLQDTFISPELFSLESIDNFIFSYQNE